MASEPKDGLRGGVGSESPRPAIFPASPPGPAPENRCPIGRGRRRRCRPAGASQPMESLLRTRGNGCRTVPAPATTPPPARRASSRNAGGARGAGGRRTKPLRQRSPERHPASARSREATAARYRAAPAESRDASANAMATPSGHRQGRPRQPSAPSAADRYVAAPPWGLTMSGRTQPGFGRSNPSVTTASRNLRRRWASPRASKVQTEGAHASKQHRATVHRGVSGLPSTAASSGGEVDHRRGRSSADHGKLPQRVRRRRTPRCRREAGPEAIGPGSIGSAAAPPSRRGCATAAMTAFNRAVRDIRSRSAT